MEGEAVFCHQCRQKTTRRVFTCHNVMGTCQLKFCDRCLRKRYNGSVDGTIITEEEASADDWHCPKCRGDCNCSACMRRHGKQPYGRVLHNSERPAVEVSAEGSEPKGEEDVGALGKRKAKAPKEPRRLKAKEIEPELPLPSGVALTTVAGIELHPHDVGIALQFVQFCGAFEEIFGLSKGQAESLLRDLVLQQYSSVFQFQARLLSVQELEVEEGIRPLNEDSWFEHLRCYFSKSQLLLKDVPSDFFSGGVERYHSLDFSQRLKVLNFLCDEALDTKKLSKYIESQEGIFMGKKREANQKISAAKAKELALKGELKAELAKVKVKAVSPEDNAALSSEHETNVSRLKSEAAHARAELLEAKALKLKLKAPDCIRTEPYLFDENGHAFWRLTGYDAGKDMLLQDVGTWEPSTSSDENWYLYGEEKKEAVEKYCSSVRSRKLMNENL